MTRSWSQKASKQWFGGCNHQQIAILTAGLGIFDPRFFRATAAVAPDHSFCFACVFFFLPRLTTAKSLAAQELAVSHSYSRLGATRRNQQENKNTCHHHDRGSRRRIMVNQAVYHYRSPCGGGHHLHLDTSTLAFGIDFFQQNWMLVISGFTCVGFSARRLADGKSEQRQSEDCARDQRTGNRAK